MATFTKKSSGWQVAIRNAGQKPIYKTFKKKAHATRWAGQIEEQIASGVFNDTSIAGKTIISDALNRFEAEILPTRRDGGKVEQSKVNIVRREFGKLNLNTLTPELIMEFINERQIEVTNDTILKDLAVINDLFETSRIVWNIPCVNPITEVRAICKKLKCLQPGKGRDRRLADDEYSKLINATTRYAGSIRGKLVAFAIETAMRQEEIARMMWVDVNHASKTLYIPRAKHGPRTVPLSAKAYDILNSLVVNINGKVWEMKKKSIGRMFKRLTVALNIEDLHFHDLRHEGTSRLFELGLSIPEVQLITGHGDWRSLQRYTKLQAANVGEKIRKLNRTNIV